MNQWKPAFISIVLLLSATSCSRGDLGFKLSLNFPFQSDQSGFAADETLKRVVAYVHIEGRSAPVIRTNEYPNDSVPLGQNINLELSNVQKGTVFMVQILALYENPTLGMTKFYYGDATGIAGKASAEVTVFNYVESDKLIKVAGRYLTSPGQGPTGTLTIDYVPPFGKPLMRVGSVPIQDGWFQIKGFESSLAGLRYSLAGTPIVLFSHLTTGAPELSSFGSGLLKIIKPVSYAPAPDGVRVSPATDIYLGFWGEVTNEKTCYALTDSFISNEFRDAALQNPLQYQTTNPAPDHVRPSGGGVGETLASLPTAQCTLIFDHENAAADAPYIR